MPVQDCWDTFLEAFDIVEADPERLRLLRRCFYAGAMSMYGLVVIPGAQFNDVRAVLQMLKQELRAFMIEDLWPCDEDQRRALQGSKLN